MNAVPVTAGQISIEDGLLSAARARLAEGPAEALALCRDLPTDQPDVLHLRTSLEAGGLPAGLDALARGLPPAPADAAHHHREGRLSTARLLYEAILRADPAHASALHNLAVLHIQAGQPFEGLDLLAQAAAHHGVSADIDATLANLTRLCLDGLAALPDEPERHRRAILPLLAKLPAAPGAYEHLMLHFGNRAARLSKGGMHAVSAKFGRIALAFDPARFDLLLNLAFATEMDGGFGAAVGLYRHAAVAAPDTSRRAYAHLMLMHLFFRLGRWEEFATLLPHKYDYAPVSWWKDYLPVPVWDGTVRPGARILINGESGFGDVIQCLRYAEYFRRHGMTACFLSDARMKALCALGTGVAEAYTHGERIPRVDFRVQSFDLFYMLERDSRRAFHPGAYIELARSPHRAPMLERRPGEMLIGIKWTTTDPTKDMPLALFSRLLVRDGIRLISLQPEPPAPDCGLTVERPLDGWFGHPDHSFTSTAWVIGQMDLVVTADSVIAHLAGAVGATAWVALRAIPDCRWLVERADSPFYESVTLFRQPAPGDWDTVMTLIAAELRHRLEETPAWPPAPVLAQAAAAPVGADTSGH